MPLFALFKNCLDCLAPHLITGLSLLVYNMSEGVSAFQLLVHSQGKQSLSYKNVTSGESTDKHSEAKL
ncbi:hypothetical protein SUGI_0008880 [Cryptomeria japonica]|nr:hypothetical protein SUGI_0008880 [Cryptomeria japonica]